MNLKRAKMIRSAMKGGRINLKIKAMLSTMYKYTDIPITDRHVYKYLKSLDNKLNHIQKGRLRAY